MTKSYLVKEIFGPTIQGEGSLAGTVSWFVRFGGCNLWDGRQETRAASACPYCDTDFFGGERLTALEIQQQLRKLGAVGRDWVTLTGGEPLLQVDRDLIRPLFNYRLALETNGTRPLPPPLGSLISKVIMSPKVPRGQIKLYRADEVKLLYPHPNPEITPKSFRDFPAAEYYLQPINNDHSLNTDNVKRAVDYCLSNPPWKLSLQIHKVLGLP